jgi:hypothetical protein
VPPILSLTLLHLHAIFNMNPSMFTFPYHFLVALVVDLHFG